MRRSEEALCDSGRGHVGFPVYFWKSFPGNGDKASKLLKLTH